MEDAKGRVIGVVLRDIAGRFHIPIYAWALDAYGELLERDDFVTPARHADAGCHSFDQEGIVKPFGWVVSQIQ